VDHPPLLAPADLDLPIADYLVRRPEAVAVFLALRFGCVGCDFSRFDTLRQALDVHGVTPQDYRARLDSLRRPPGEDRIPIPSEGDTA
jgi:hybrid cluster-associated redox disulfide protein